MKVRIIEFFAAIAVLIFVAAIFAVIAARLDAAEAATTRQRVTFRCDGEPSYHSDWPGDDDVLVRNPVTGRWRCKPLDSLLPRLLTGYYPDGHAIYGNHSVTDGDGGTGG